MYPPQSKRKQKPSHKGREKDKPKVRNINQTSEGTKKNFGGKQEILSIGFKTPRQRNLMEVDQRKY